MTVLAAPAGLLDVLPFGLGRAADGLAKRNLRLADLGFNLELSQKPVDDDFQVQLAHSGNDRLRGLLIRTDAKRRVLLGQLLQRKSHLFLVRLGLRLNRHGDDRLGEFHLLQQDLMILVAERVARRGVLQPHRRGDVARVDRVDILALVRVHLQQAADAIARALDHVVDRRARLQCAGVDPEIGQLAGKRIGHDLECQRGEWLIIGRLPLQFFIGGRIDAGDGRNIQRRGEKIHDGIQQLLDTLVLEGRSANDRRHLHGDGAGPDGPHDLLLGQGISVEILFHHLIVELRHRLEHLVAILLTELGHIGGNVRDHVLRAERLIVVQEGLHLDEIDRSAEFRLPTDRQLNRHRGRTEAIDHGLHAGIKVRPDSIHLVHERDAGHPILVRLPPDRFRLRLYALDRIEDRHRAVQDAQGTLDLDRKVDVARGIDDIDAEVPPEAGGGGGGDGDPALLFLLHPVHRGGAVMDLAHLMGDARIIKDALGRRRLPGIDVRHDADIACSFERMRPSHDSPQKTGVLQRDASFPFAAEPRIRTRPQRDARPDCSTRDRNLPAIMGKGLVGLGHAMDVFPLLHRQARIVGRVHQFPGQLVAHALSATTLSGLGDPPHRQ